MNVIGHPYVAFKALGRLTEDLVLGSYLPDIVPFVPNSVFEFREIHEGGKKFLDFLDKRRPEKRDLALGMLCHGDEFGADKFSKRIEERFEDQREELAERIAEASKISLEVASRARFRNFLWWGVDVQILKHRREFVEDLAEKVSELNIFEAAKLLAKCFGKNEADVVRDISFLLKPLTSERLLSVRGLVEIWKDMVAGLPEKDQVDVEKTKEIFENCAELVESSWEQVVKDTITEVRGNLQNLRVVK